MPGAEAPSPTTSFAVKGCLKSWPTKPLYPDGSRGIEADPRKGVARRVDVALEVDVGVVDLRIGGGDGGLDEFANRFVAAVLVDEGLALSFGPLDRLDAFA